MPRVPILVYDELDAGLRSGPEKAHSWRSRFIAPERTEAVGLNVCPEEVARVRRRVNVRVRDPLGDCIQVGSAQTL